MNRQRQFSLAYLFMEVFWIAGAMGCASALYRLPLSPAYDALLIPLGFGAAACTGAAIGGLFHRMTFGLVTVIVTLAAFVASFGCCVGLFRLLTR